MVKKIIILTSTEFTKKEFEKNSIKNFLEKNIKIEVWIIGKTYLVDYEINRKVLFIHKSVKIRIIPSSNNLKYYFDKIKNNSLSCLFDLRIKLTLRNMPFFKVFFLYNFNYIIFPSLLLSRISLHYSLYLKIINLIIRINFLFSKVKIKCAKYIYLISEKSYVKNNLLISKKTKSILGHHADFDKYLKFRKKKIVKNKFKYFVFLDQNVPNHTDLTRLFPGDLNEKKYYNSLLVSFKKVEKQFNYKCLISAHPRAEIKTLKKYFGNMLSIKSSHDLIQNCEFVLTHDSVATNFAFLYEKPIISIINDELLSTKYNHKKESLYFCKRAKLKLINISRDKFTKKDLVVNKKEYKDYVRKYIKINNIEENRAGIILKKLNF
tara:strand:+ start:10178 stop:11311 length:1134 start_codon:yes stop_codon:yes gene_type:complete